MLEHRSDLDGLGLQASRTNYLNCILGILGRVVELWLFKREAKGLWFAWK